ncbi:DUF134 domain-containing protein [archaeon]|nr:DUF134 domain-containing protein [archaeon]
MPRPRRCRKVGLKPNIDYFKPAGRRITELEEVILTVSEFESIRLKDLMDLDQGIAAKKMGISQSTFHRSIVSARKKLADAIINGKAIKIKGGKFKLVDMPLRTFECIVCKTNWEVPFGTGRPSNCPKCKSKNIYRK